MAPSPTELYLPPTFPYPIKIVSIDAQPTSSVQRGARLLGYSFVHLALTPDSQPETRFGTWDSPIEGTLEKWNFAVDDVISQRRAKEKPVVVVIEPCKHGMQFSGLCVLCGKDMTKYAFPSCSSVYPANPSCSTDYTGFSDASRASIQMTHSAYGPTVSPEEAQRIERETAEHLLKARKLSLIVDLDQTIVHATVDPTVGEWIAEGEMWEARQANKASSSKPADDSDDSSSDSDDECNPNWEALKDVKRFRLGPESFGSARSQRVKGKNKAIENEGCMYYIKPRPGWKEFLPEMAKKYEMHVYTMGTRAYAEEVCAAIDPDGSIFGGRLLSRDESGSLTQKSLQRLFPCDTSMVVIIDDRADVWEWSPNLVKVIPCSCHPIHLTSLNQPYASDDFFVGIGDINSTFLPKLESLTPILPADPGPKLPSNPNNEKLDSTDSQVTPVSVDDGDSLPPTPLVVAEVVSVESDEVDLAKTTMVTRNNLALEAQLEERPLAKRQEALSEGDPPHEHHHHPHHHQADAKKADDDAEMKEVKRSITPKPERKALLKNDDFELERISKAFHDRFFNSYDSYNSRKTGRRRPEKPPCDVTVSAHLGERLCLIQMYGQEIIPRIRTEVLEGVHILFSSVIPLDTRPESTEIWKMAHMFGARVSTELKPDITHVVAAKRGTVKVDMARKRGGIKIVWLAWFTDSIALWKHQDETAYLLDEPPVAGPSSSPDAHQISSDPEPDADDWDEEVVEGKEPRSLELGAIDWNDINDEVDAFLNETDDDDDARSDATGMRSGVASEDEDAGGDMSVYNTPRASRKRLRSVTPSDSGSTNGGRDDDVLRSPLSKRKKIAANRTGYSRLKEAICADDLETEKNGLGVGNVVGNAQVNSLPRVEDAMEEDEEDEDDDEDEEDDFLARELEEEWG
ncbi:hypothetical protein H0H81_003063 [Sphagnurus paluster]|uniref:RNA polymerase II subunit A C-terminal domain phosphatase n=1 Tax=Sphagnurus paluster TaxID=117069 RepID=A0A9P7KLN5_9AGAR|nr:hypothetical protein H0H81_003063 [Sphagnurus paluster]